MSKDLMIYFDEDGVAKVYDDTYDITIHCESEEEKRKAIEFIKARKWIPCSTALPKDEEEVIVSIHDDSGDRAFDYSSSGWYAAAGEFWVVDNEANMCVTAWMPLPHPYRGGEQR